MHGGFTIRCIVRYDVTIPQSIVTIGRAGFTEFHPIKDKNNEWVHPKNVGIVNIMDIPSVYNIVLDFGHTLSLDGTIACSLAHDFEGPVISHSYFGAKNGNLPHVLDDLKTSPGWDIGYVVLKNVKEIRDANGEIIQLISS